MPDTIERFLEVGEIMKVTSDDRSAFPPTAFCCPVVLLCDLKPVSSSSKICSAWFTIAR